MEEEPADEYVASLVRVADLVRFLVDFDKYKFNVFAPFSMVV
jgi:hypothetical protein